MTIRLDFEENEIPILSDGLQQLPYARVVALITRLQKQIDDQVKPKDTPVSEVVTDV